MGRKTSEVLAAFLKALDTSSIVGRPTEVVIGEETRALVSSYTMMGGETHWSIWRKDIKEIRFVTDGWGKRSFNTYVRDNAENFS